MQVAESGDEELLGNVVAFNPERRVFFGHARERCHQFFIIAFACGSDCVRDDGIRELDTGELDLRVSIAERVAGLGRRKFSDRPDIACFYLWCTNRVFPIHEDRFSEPLDLSARRIADLRIAFQDTRINAEKTELPSKGIRDGFENDSSHRCF